jgi:hypothetical protein
MAMRVEWRVLMMEMDALAKTFPSRVREVSKGE